MVKYYRITIVFAITNSKRARAATALRLARHFGNSAGFWMGLQMDYDLDTAADELAARIKK